MGNNQVMFVDAMINEILLSNPVGRAVAFATLVIPALLLQAFHMSRGGLHFACSLVKSAAEMAERRRHICLEFKSYREVGERRV